MRIVNLVENTEGKENLEAEHGLCFYIETAKHKLLMDTGASDLLLENAARKGIDLTFVDTVVLSHGHYDHGGGIRPFRSINHRAIIYVPKKAFGEFYSTSRDKEPKYIGIDKKIKNLANITLVDEGVMIDDEISVFGKIGNKRKAPDTNKRLFIKIKGELVNDDFSHEQCLVIKQGNDRFLFSGCAHHGILNILDKFKDIYGTYPKAVFSGLHTIRKNGYSEEDKVYIRDTANELKKTGIRVYTFHCTGQEPFEIMKEILGDQISYIHCGDEITID